MLDEHWAQVISLLSVYGGDGKPFETCVKEMVVSGTGAFPRGVEAGIQTMRESEKALITVQPAIAFGAAGDASKGVPPDSVVEYEVTCHRIIETIRLEKGCVVKRRMVRRDRPEPPDSAEARRVACT